MSELRARTEEAAPPPAPSVENGGPRPSVSVIVPVVERPEPLAALYEEYSAPFREDGESFEFIFVVEPWAGHFRASLDELVRRGEPIRVLEAGRETDVNIDL